MIDPRHGGDHVLASLSLYAMVVSVSLIVEFFSILRQHESTLRQQSQL